CRRLDGMPLAIELAAARVGVLAPAEIAARLDDRFRLLSAGSRTAAPRHQSLEAALEWSYDLLSESERVLLARLSVFAGGFTPGEQARYRLLETIRHYAADRLTAAEGAQDLGDRHAAYYARVAELAEPELIEAQQGVWIERLEAEHANLRAALGWSLTRGQPERGLRLAGALGLFWLGR